MVGGRVSTLPDVVKLLPSFDVNRLLEDFDAVREQFLAHSNPPDDYSDEGDAGGWDMLPLRCPGGDPDQIGEGTSGMEDYADTVYLESTPYVREILDSLDVPVRGVRFSAVAPGAAVHEHTDRPYGLQAGWVRLHAPVITNDQAVLFFNGVPSCWQPGEFWYGNFGAPHRIYNKGDTARIHLIIDCYISENLFKLFPAEIRENINKEDVIFFAEEQSLPEGLSTLSGTVRIPPSFVNRYPDPPSESDWRARGQADIEAELGVQNGRLFLRLGGHGTALAYLGDGEFRPLCFSSERTMTIESRAGVRWISFRHRHGGNVLTTARKQPSL